SAVLMTAPAGGPGLGFERVLDDLAVQGAAADLEHARRFLLVPAHRVEHPPDVRALRVGERRQTIAERLGDRLRRVEELDVAGADCPPWRRQRGTRDGAFELTD